MKSGEKDASKRQKEAGMSENHFPGGVWPVMLAPFTEDGKIDYRALGELVEWYIKNGSSGLFAVCQSTEMFCLTLEERVGYASFVRKQAAGRVPVIASGHISDSFEEQAEEICAVADTGVDAVILITNRLAREKESDEVWLQALWRLLDAVPRDVKLGFYECPYPYKRVLSPELLRTCAKTGRFYFLKDTCCDIRLIEKKLEAIRGTNMKLYNANTATLLESLRLGAAGYSGVMANMQCSLYAALCADPCGEKMRDLADALTICALIERQVYPVNAKYYLQREGLPITTVTRTKDASLLDATAKSEVEMLRRVTGRLADLIR